MYSEIKTNNEETIGPNYQQYTNQLNTLKDGIQPILDEFKKLYILYNMHPQNQEYQQQFQNIRNNLNQVESKLFSIANEIQVNINNINKLLFAFIKDIEKEKDTNHTLKKKLGIMENENNAATKLIDNYKEMYEHKYLSNWALGLSTLLCVYTISKIFKKQEIV